MGEMANMVAGHIKSHLPNTDVTCALTIPTILRGKDFAILPTSTHQRRVYGFDCEGNPLFVEVLAKP
jgi:CheY-specific phosphatase CheX